MQLTGLFGHSRISAHCAPRGEIINPVAWHGRDLSGEWIVTTKRDGVRAIWRNGQWSSRANKPLYNVPEWRPGTPMDCEVFVGSFRDTIRAIRTKHVKADTPTIEPYHLYGLAPLDPRLFRRVMVAPTAAAIVAELASAISEGHEGLVLRQGATWLKVKPRETIDLEIIGATEGTGKHAGTLGALITPRGSVGTASCTDVERAELWAEFMAGRLVGQIAECVYMQRTAAGKLRHGQFCRLRPDKVTGQ